MLKSCSVLNRPIQKDEPNFYSSLCVQTVELLLAEKKNFSLTAISRTTIVNRFSALMQVFDALQCSESVQKGL
jgi:hypothetical protein